MTYPSGTYSADTLALQRALILHGFDVGKDGADGLMGNDTIKAIAEAREAFAIDPPGNRIDLPLLVALGVRSASPPPNPKGTIMNNVLGSIFSGLLKNLLNWQLVQGYIRGALITVGGWVGLDGFVGQSGSQAIIGALMVIIGVIFQAISDNTKKKALDVVKAADAAPDVTVIPAHDTASGKPIVTAAQ